MNNSILTRALSLILILFVSKSFGMDRPPQNSSEDSYSLSFSGEQDFIIRKQEAIEKFNDVNLKNISVKPNLHLYPNTKLITLSLPKYEFIGATAYYTRDIAKLRFDNFSNEEISSVIPMDNLWTHGYITIPSGNGPFPCAILCHGSEGADPYYLNVATLLAEKGIASLLFDRFWGNIFKLEDERVIHLKNTLYNQFSISLENEILQMVGAIKLMESHPLIDPLKIGYIGWSRGGNVAFECTLKETLEKVYPSFKPAFCINYYSMPLIHKKGVLVAPTLFLHGADDQYTPISVLLTALSKMSGEELVIKTKASGDQAIELQVGDVPIKVRAFLNSGHGFDVVPKWNNLLYPESIESFFQTGLFSLRYKWNEFVNGSFKVVEPEFVNLKNCSMEVSEEAKGFKAMIDGKTYPWSELLDFLDTHKTLGVVLEFNPQAGFKAQKVMMNFLDKQLNKQGA